MNSIKLTLMCSASFLLACTGLEGTEDPSLRGGGGLQQSQCPGLGEQACLTTPGCELVYSACAKCAPGPDCPPCPTPVCQKASTQYPPPPPSSCAGLDESSCNSRSDCFADYAYCTAACEHDGDGGCKPCDPAYGGCFPIQPPPPSNCIGLDERACNQAPGCIGMYSGACPPCPPGAACAPCDPSSFTFSDCADDSTCSGGWGGSGGAIDAGSPTDP